jgi:hypothetical protein
MRERMVRNPLATNVLMKATLLNPNLSLDELVRDIPRAS